MQTITAMLVLFVVCATVTGAGYLLYLATLEVIASVKRLISRVRGIKVPNPVHMGRKTYHRARRKIVGTGKKMEWKRSVVADIIYDALLEAMTRGAITKKQSRYLQDVIARAADIPDLLPRKQQNAYAREYFFGTSALPPRYEKLAGPKKKLPTPPDPKVVTHSAFLQRMKEKKSA